MRAWGRLKRKKRMGREDEERENGGKKGDSRERQRLDKKTSGIREYRNVTKDESEREERKKREHVMAINKIKERLGSRSKKKKKKI